MQGKSSLGGQASVCRLKQVLCRWVWCIYRLQFQTEQHLFGDRLNTYSISLGTELSERSSTLGFTKSGPAPGHKCPQLCARQCLNRNMFCLLWAQFCLPGALLRTWRVNNKTYTGRHGAFKDCLYFEVITHFWLLCTILLKYLKESRDRSRLSRNL